MWDASSRSCSALMLTMSCDAGPRHPLRFACQPDGGLKPYLLVRGRLEALLTRARYFDLVELAEPRRRSEPERLGIWSDGAFFALPA